MSGIETTTLAPLATNAYSGIRVVFIFAGQLNRVLGCIPLELAVRRLREQYGRSNEERNEHSVGGYDLQGPRILLPQAYVYRPEMGATRDLLRRRLHFRRKRSELLAHIQNTNSQYNLPEFEKQLTYASNRTGVVDRFVDPSVQKTIEVDLALLAYYDQMLRELEYFILRTARGHDHNTLYRLRTVPGIGKILSLVMLYEIHDINRFERPQELASYAR